MVSDIERTADDLRQQTTAVIAGPTLDLLSQSKSAAASPKQHEILVRLLIDAHEHVLLALREELSR